MVTVRHGIDFIDVQTPREALDHMLTIVENTAVEASKVADVVGFTGLSVKETVEAYAAFEKEHGAEIIEFSERGKKKLWKGVA